MVNYKMEQYANQMSNETNESPSEVLKLLQEVYHDNDVTPRCAIVCEEK